MAAHVDPAFATPGAGDYEDFFEDATRLDAAIAAAGLENVWLHRRGEAKNLATGEVKKPGAGWQPWGVQSSNSLNMAVITPGFHPLQVELDVDRYPHWNVFQQNAGRRLHLAGVGLEGAGFEMVDAIRDLVADGGKIVVKTVQSKKGIWFNEISGPDDAQRFVDDAIMDIAFHMLGAPRAFLVQQHVTMEYEYRLFVVDGQVVTGAGAIEEHTPIDATCRPFNNAVRKNRALHSPIEDRPDIVDELVYFGQHIADEIKAGPGVNLTRYVLDVAIGENGPLIVEFNSMLNSGLYASDPTAVARKVNSLRS
ncbi:ATP-grasp domain-containing protein [Agromyces sp. NPDC057679]|uniref:ATP-grasp domain-containing protein n=1 Tax=Agromyces sp. NPDC057679 TaxID=3346207 RepID=UPI00366DBCDB